ncbi:MAG: WYL domain-containing transcriptional regulator [Deltaproteobacteria bacterium]|nr:MAG: WYL domain-containing transcriptional regulator [Deltaproteobacteria bacterium]
MTKRAPLFEKKFDAILSIAVSIMNGERHTPRSLAEKLGVTERTVYRYVKALESVGVPVYFDRDRGCYAFPEGYSLKKAHLTTEELIAFSLARSLVKGFGKRFDDVMGSIERKLLKERKDLSRFIVIEGGSISPEVDDHLLEISRAIREERRIEIRYHAVSTGEETVRKVDPYFLFFADGFWHLRGFCHLRGEPRTFSVDRILELTVLEEHFLPGEEDPAEVFARAFGSFVDGDPVRVTVRFSPRVREHVLRRKWHETQKTKKRKDGSVDLTFEVNGVDGIKPWIYRFIPNAEVISPAWFRKQVREELESALSAHSPR